jgi:type 2A phosphatase activator TIP41
LQKIDYEKLKVKEPILFFDDIILYEDELDDNGVSKLSAKIVIPHLKKNDLRGQML